MYFHSASSVNFISEESLLLPTFPLPPGVSVQPRGPTDDLPGPQDGLLDLPPGTGGSSFPTLENITKFPKTRLPMK